MIELVLEAGDRGPRAGTLITPHGCIPTPVFMPVGTQATVKSLSPRELHEIGAGIVLANAYHLMLRPGAERIAAAGGLHRFMGWSGALLTDSGGFQVFSLGGLRRLDDDGATFRSHIDGSEQRLTPERAMRVQEQIGADIIMAFDECTEHPAERQRAKDSMDLTLRWARRSQTYFEAHKDEVPWRCGGANDDRRPIPGYQSLFGIVQGGMYPDLRRECAERLVEMDFPGYAIGGLSVGEPRPTTYEIVEATLPHLPQDKPRYLMGVGTPEEIVEYAALGIDMMDCVLPTRAARHGLLFTSVGKINIKNSRYALDDGPLDPNCGCRVCARYSRAYLRHLYSSSEILAQVLNTVHNLAFYLDTMQGVRQAINLGEFSRFHSGIRSRGLNSPAHT